MSVQLRPLGLPGAFEIQPQRYFDERGFFGETWSADALRRAGIDIDFVQDNHSYSNHRGVLRGLHYQLEPHAQDKLVRVIRGAIFDVIVDIRPNSDFFGKWVGVEVTAARWNQVLVPKGYAHGFLVLEPDTEVIYKVSHAYSREHERSIRYDDPDLAIRWPAWPGEIQLSQKDADAPRLAQAVGATRSMAVQK